MIESSEFLKSVLDTITDHIVVIDREGNIIFVNHAWSEFGQNNSCLDNNDWQGVNYLKICDQAATTGDDFGLNAANGIRAVINNKKTSFFFEYPCHSPDEKRWFMMRVTSFMALGEHCYVISHQNITERKLVEEEALKLSRLDGLTNIPNRRCFDEFLANEWLRCKRLKMPISLAIIDLDYFKSLNDAYGHQEGDDCLRQVAAVLTRFTKRPADLCARYGGEEFSIILGNTEKDASLKIINNILDAIRELRIPNKDSPTLPTLTASIGLMTMYPDNETSENDLLKSTDTLLYTAKESGRNKIIYNSD